MTLTMGNSCFAVWLGFTSKVLAIMLFLSVPLSSASNHPCTCPGAASECTQEPANGLCRHIAYKTAYYQGYRSYRYTQINKAKRSCGSWGRQCNYYWTTYHIKTIPAAHTTSMEICKATCCDGYSLAGENSCEPICAPGCLNGGTCVSPSTCACPSQYTGDRCENAIRVQLRACPSPITEGKGAVDMCMTVSIPFKQETAVPASVTSETALIGSDFFQGTVQGVFKPGMVEACFQIDINDDSDCELQETFKVQISTPTSDYLLGQLTSCVVQILDNDRVEMSFRSDQYSVEETAGEVEVCVAASCPCPKPMNCHVLISNGSAMPGTDYPEQSLSVQFRVDEAEACTQVKILNDVIPESKENFLLTLLPGADYDMGEPDLTSVIVLDVDSYCRSPPNFPGISYIGSSQDLMTGHKLQYMCGAGFEILDENRQYAGPRGLAVCGQHSWKLDKHCYDIKECDKVPKVCEKHCREIIGSYECFCDGGERLVENDYGCTRECGHIPKPNGTVMVKYNPIRNGIQKAKLSCMDRDAEFAGGKSPSVQYCIGGLWNFQVEPTYDIPGCEVPKPSVGQAGIDSVTGLPCVVDPQPSQKNPITVKFAAGTTSSPFSANVTGKCIPNKLKRSTGHVVLQFTVETPIPVNCTDDCIRQKLQSLQPAALQVFNAIKSGSVRVILTLPSGVTTQPIVVNPHPVWSHLGQTCESGAVFRDNQCLLCSPGSFYNEETKECQFCPSSQYQDERGQTSCMDCPEGTITRRKGTNSEEGCIVKCPAGQYSTEGDGYEPCWPCADGSWQNEEGASFCYACEYGQMTGRKGATGLSECSCPEGRFGQDCSWSCSCQNDARCLETGYCVCTEGWTGLDCSIRECPPGVTCYPGATCVLTPGGETQCGSCPIGMTGDGLQCEPGVLCTKGTYYNVSTDNCEPCPLAFYQDEDNQLSCKSCPKQLETDATGGSSLADCKLVCKRPCQNGGTCSTPNTCTCASGWTGPQCQTAICSPSCLNGGTCSMPNTCSCPHGWTGAQCQTSMCSRACRNNGTCVALDTCKCAVGWTGRVCQKAVCSPSCRNGGTCASPGQCHCLNGWRGDHCHQHFCSPGCENEGTCSGPLTCDCPALWEGSYCQTSVCPTPCANGGTCVGRDSCSCTPGWTGGHCQTFTCSPGCKNGGTCSGPNTCDCFAGTRGNRCGTRVLVQLEGCPFNGSEVTGSVQICAKSSHPFTAKTSVGLQLTDGSAEVGSDYTKTFHQVVFSPGETLSCVTIQVEDDDVCEVTEDFTVTLTAPAVKGLYYLRGNRRTCQATIKDSEVVYLEFQQSSYQASEESPSSVEVCVVASCPCPQQIKAGLVLSAGTAVEGEDYPPQAPSITFQVGSVRECTEIRLIDDKVPEDREQFEVTVVLSGSDDYTIGVVGFTHVVITDSDVICRMPPVLSGMKYVALDSSVQYCADSSVQFTCKSGYQLEGNSGVVVGVLGTVTCTEGGWKFSGLCKDIKECQNPETCGRHCQEIEGSYQCFCDAHEVLDDFQFSCIRECGHVIVPDGVNAPEYTNTNGLQKADLSCTRTGHVFSGEKDPTPQFCFKGQWSYEVEGYAIPGCEALSNSSASIGMNSTHEEESCNTNEPVDVDVDNFEDFFNFDDVTSFDVDATCESNSRKRSTGHVVLHFTVQKSIAPTCTGGCVRAKLLGLRSSALAVSNAIKSNKLRVTLTTATESHSIVVNPVPVWNHVGQRCQRGADFRDNQCVPCSPGSFYNKETKECQFCPLSQYQDERGQTSSKDCPEGTITRRKGTNSKEGCIVKCPAGQYSTEGDGYEPCLPCADGSWQSQAGASFCHFCDYGHKTGREGATGESACGCPPGSFGQDCAQQCRCENGGTCQGNGSCACVEGWSGHDCSYKVSCSPGTFYEESTEMCLPCPLSQYQDDKGQPTCKTCPDGKTTTRWGAMKSSECIHIESCLPGSFYNEETKECQLCPPSQYQDERGQTSCKDCLQGRVSSWGADSVEDCLACSTFCHPGVDCKVNGTGQVVCEACPEGLTGDGFSCYPVCNGMAANVYLLSFLPNYRARGTRSVTLLASDSTSVTKLSRGNANTHHLTAGVVETLTKSTTAEPIAICSPIGVDLTTVGINKESRSLDAFRVSQLSKKYQSERYVIGTPENTPGYSLQNVVAISAFYNSTSVQLGINSTVRHTVTGTWDGSSSPPHYLLNSLDYISIVGLDDLSGSEVTSDKPVSVFAGHQCAHVPVGQDACDHAVEQIPPVSKLGTLFILSAFKRDVPEDFMKVVSTQGGNEITVKCLNGTANTTSELTIQLGGNEYTQVPLSKDDICVLHSSHPVLVLQLSTGGSLSALEEGDPSMSVVPGVSVYFQPGQQLNFISPDLETSYKHYVNIFVHSPPGVSPAVPTLDGSNLGSFEEIAVPASLLPAGFNDQLYVYRASVEPGPHSIESTGRVAAVIYGYLNSEMYSYTLANN